MVDDGDANYSVLVFGWRRLFSALLLGIDDVARTFVRCVTVIVSHAFSSVLRTNYFDIGRSMNRPASYGGDASRVSTRVRNFADASPFNETRVRQNGAFPLSLNHMPEDLSNLIMCISS